jgi:uncharacterized protein YbjT (DUF2867 family)
MRNSGARLAWAAARLAAMRVLVAGASGFIGRAVARALAREGHEVVGVSRHGDIAVDFNAVPEALWWARRLAGIDAVVNAVGILREQDGQTFDALHTRAPVELFRGCVAARVPFVVQVSALGAGQHASTAYQSSKKAADDALRVLPLNAAIVQPSLVYGPGGASARFFDTLAASPLLTLPLRGAMRVQPVHLDDVAAGIARLLRERQTGIATIAFVGPRAMSLRDYLARLRLALGLRRSALVLPFPVPLFAAFAAVAGHVRGSFVDRDTARMLLAGNTADAGPFARLLGRAPRDVDGFIPPEKRAALRTQALLGVWMPVLRVSLAVMWIWTGIVSFGLYPVQDSLALLARVGLHGVPALVALYGAAASDLVLGVLTLVLPRRERQWLWPAQLLLIAGYTVLITVFLPEYWLHPYGPISKNLPILAAIALLAALDREAAR